MTNLPTGTVTFLFTDIEGSTILAQEHPDKWESLRARHHAILQTAMDIHNGYLFQIIGDAFCVAFHTAGDALQAAINSQVGLQAESWGNTPIKVRMGIHTGKAEVQADGQYHGYLALSRVQRLMSAAHGGQVLISLATEELVRDEMPEDVYLRDMGEKRLKDLIRSEHIYQLVISNLPADFPSIKTLDAYHHNLPIQLTNFIGREKELAEVKESILMHRLITLTGVGGTGKTRLALHAAADSLDKFHDGVWLVELAPLSDPALIPQAVATALGLREQSERMFLDILKNYLSRRNLLLLLDNCEHLIDACAQLADALLHSAPHLKILATGREALGIAGEFTYPVRSLSLPDPRQPLPEILSQYDAVRLFIDRAVAVQPKFRVTNQNALAVAQVCARLDGIPLAIELAAARVRGFSVEQIASHLDDLFRLLMGGSRTALPRHQTMRATIDWSYDLLSETERLLLRRIAVFTGGWTLEVAERVCSDEIIDHYEILNLLGRLVEKSLVEVVEDTAGTRYRILETVRQYARDKLFESGEGEKIRDQHLKAFIDLAEKAEPEIRGPNQLIWLDRLDEEVNNLRTALEWSQESDKESFLRLASALWRFWSLRAYDDPDYEWLPQALASTEGLQTVPRARALGRASFIAQDRGDVERAAIWAKEAEISSRAIGDKPGLAMALTMQGVMETDQTQAPALLVQGLNLARELDDHWLAAYIFIIRASPLLNRNELISARSLLEQCMEEARLSGDKRRISMVLETLGVIALAEDDAPKAEKWFKEGLTEAQAIRDHAHIFWGYQFILLTKIFLEDYADAKEIKAEMFRLAQIGKIFMSNAFHSSAWLDLAHGNVSGAIEHLEEGLILARQTPRPYLIVDLLLNLGDTFRRNRDFVQALAKFKEALSLIREEKLDDGYHCVYLEGMGILATDQGQAIRGACLLGAREKLRATVFVYDFLPFMVRERESRIAKAREQLGEEVFNKAWAEGAAMSTEDALKFALEESNE